MTPIEPLVKVPETVSLEIDSPDHTQLPESDGTFVKNFQEHPQSIILTSSIQPILQKLHPDGQYCIGQDSGIYWKQMPAGEDPLQGVEAPDWFYVPHVPPFLQGQYRRSYVLWKEKVIPLIALEFVSGNGLEERDKTPPGTIDLKTGKPRKNGKFWIYEREIKIPFYGIYEVKKAAVEVYQLIDDRYGLIAPNSRNHYEIPEMGVELGILYGQEETPIPWLRWWDLDGNLLLTGDERAIQSEIVAERQRLIAEQQRSFAEQQWLIAEQERSFAEQQRLIAEQQRLIAEQERQEKEKLAAYLRSLGINPEEIT